MAGAILLYHRVGLRVPDASRLCVGIEEFQAHMRHLMDCYQPTALERLSVAAESSNRHCVAVTFDDGYLEHLTVISPILLEVGIPATFFVNTAALNTGCENWWDTLERIFLTARELPELIDLPGAGRVSMLSCSRAEMYSRLHAIAYALSADERERFVHGLMSWSGLDFTPRLSHRVMTGPEVAELASRQGHSIGAHTVNHLALPFHSMETVRREIEHGKQDLESFLVRPLSLFAYPYGHYSNDVRRAVSEAGFMTAVTVEPGLVTRGSDRLRLPRLEVRHCTHSQFAGRLAAAFESVEAGQPVLKLHQYQSN